MKHLQSINVMFKDQQMSQLQNKAADVLYNLIIAKITKSIPVREYALRALQEIELRRPDCYIPLCSVLSQCWLVQL